MRCFGPLALHSLHRTLSSSSPNSHLIQSIRRHNPTSANPFSSLQDQLDLRKPRPDLPGAPSSHKKNPSTGPWWQPSSPSQERAHLILFLEVGHGGGSESAVYMEFNNTVRKRMLRSHLLKRGQGEVTFIYEHFYFISELAI